jgi:hypothetical protein
MKKQESRDAGNRNARQDFVLRDRRVAVYGGRMSDATRDHGVQPVEGLMEKVTRAVNDAIFKSLPAAKRADFVPYLHRHLFNYAKGYDSSWSDPNDALCPK